jgi:hypothetical protein
MGHLQVEYNINYVCIISFLRAEIANKIDKSEVTPDIYENKRKTFNSQFNTYPKTFPS